MLTIQKIIFYQLFHTSPQQEFKKNVSFRKGFKKWIEDPKMTNLP